MEHLQSLLYWISSAFLLPALLAILCLFVYATYLAGGVFAEAFDRRANRAALRVLYEGEPRIGRFLRLEWKLSLGRFAEAAAKHPERLDKAVADLENDLRRGAEKLSVLSRTGPMLGLIGTLIPLQPALAGLAAGDMQAMASNLLIGFTTTVVGLIVGGVSYALGVQVRHWGRKDLTEMHYLMELWSANAGREGASDAEETG